MKKALAMLGIVGVSAMSFAQEAANASTELKTYMEGLEGDVTANINNILPVLGEIATIGIVVFLAFWAFRAVKRFLGR